MLLTVVSIQELAKTEKLIHSVDEDAFVVINRVSEVSGRGFSSKKRYLEKEEFMTLQQLRYALTIAGCGSMNEAAKRLFLSQPSLSETVKELEQEIGLQIFMRSNRGIIITPEGEEFLGYARRVIDQYGILKARYVEKQRKEKFSVSMQHYTFAVKAFVETVKKAGMDSYEFAANETTTYDVMENVRNFKSEIGVLYLNDFNEQVLMKIIREKGWSSRNCLLAIPMSICGQDIRLQGRA